MVFSCLAEAAGGCWGALWQTAPTVRRSHRRSSVGDKVIGETGNLLGMTGEVIADGQDRSSGKVYQVILWQPTPEIATIPEQGRPLADAVDAQQEDVVERLVAIEAACHGEATSDEVPGAECASVMLAEEQPLADHAQAGQPGVGDEVAMVKGHAMHERADHAPLEDDEDIVEQLAAIEEACRATEYQAKQLLALEASILADVLQTSQCQAGACAERERERQMLHQQAPKFVTCVA